MQCMMSTVDGVKSSSVMITWMGPGGSVITNSSRVIISLTNSTGNNYTSSLQFTYLKESDAGTYTCNVTILSTVASDSVSILNITG